MEAEGGSCKGPEQAQGWLQAGSSMWPTNKGEIGFEVLSSL